MTENTPYLIAGLGNPGPDYRRNRHNAGFMVADTLSETAGIPIRRVELRALGLQGRLAGKPADHPKPQTFMNDSGVAVGAADEFYKVPTEPNTCWWCMTTWTCASARSGCALPAAPAARRGWKSIVGCAWGRTDFARLRCGHRAVRRAGWTPRDYVLHDFDPPQQEETARCPGNGRGRHPALHRSGDRKSDERFQRQCDRRGLMDIPGTDRRAPGLPGADNSVGVRAGHGGLPPGPGFAARRPSAAGGSTAQRPQAARAVDLQPR